MIRKGKTPVGEPVERHFNAPTFNKVAIVMVANESYLQYPIIFWQGEDGYHFHLKQTNPQMGLTKNKKISNMEFYAFRIMIRTESPKHILLYRQLFLRYIIGMYAKIESERLLCIKLNQQKLRVEEYIHLRDAITNDGNVTDIGRMTILPTTYIGSARLINEYSQNAMTYVRSYGRPDLFITFTCNTAWSEIKELEHSQSPANCHDLIARVFRQKLIKLIDIITKSCIYGEVNCCMYSIEWQNGVFRMLTS
ncbi:hypothetical protein AVEN_235591-1 [Araneus ventricosus]|uniref:Helitron helicase-like domain-containing protein n=1 Tax=Araneus ventricosus TaxID=182803 RepID=A0A4Y2BS45_ARAVE|nr:hypothetical protein AVEN_235591-1 [Araneus ventricosus]